MVVVRAALRAALTTTLVLDCNENRYSFSRSTEKAFLIVLSYIESIR